MALARQAAVPTTTPIRSPSPARSPESRAQVVLPDGCLRVTTFQTRSRDETRALQAEAESEKRRYVPPGRPVFQSFVARNEPPTNTAMAEAIDIFPFIRIGDTIEINFKTLIPFEELSEGFQMSPQGQTALGFAAPSANGDGHNTIEFEVYYYSFADGTCLPREHRNATIIPFYPAYETHDGGGAAFPVSSSSVRPLPFVSVCERTLR